jgi:hypothetical protein
MVNEEINKSQGTSASTGSQKPKTNSKPSGSGSRDGNREMVYYFDQNCGAAGGICFD